MPDRSRSNSLGKVAISKIFASLQAYLIIIINNKTGEIKLFISIRRTAKFINIHHSYLSEYLKINKFYIGKGYYITKHLI